MVGSTAGVAVAGAAASGLLTAGTAFASGPESEAGQASAADLETLRRPMVLVVRDVEAGEVGVLVGEEEIVFTDPALVARLARALR